MGRVLLTVGNYGDFNAVGLFLPILDGAVRQPMGTKRGPLVEPPKLGCSDGFEEIRHGWVLEEKGGSLVELTACRL